MSNKQHHQHVRASQSGSSTFDLPQPSRPVVLGVSADAFPLILFPLGPLIIPSNVPRAPNPLSVVQLPARPIVITSKADKEAETKEEKDN